MKNSISPRLAIWCVAIITIFFFTRCAVALEGIAVEDMAVLQESGVATTAAGGLVVTDEAAFCNELERVHIEVSDFGNPKLFITSESEPFAEVVAKDRIRLINGDNYAQELSLPGDLYKVKGNLVNVRTSPLIADYNVFKQVSSDQLVLVKDLIGDSQGRWWYQVQLGDNIFGYICATLLTPVTTSTNKTIDTPTPNISTPKCTIPKINVRHNVYQNNICGVEIRMSFSIVGALRKNCLVEANAYDSSGNPFKASNYAYAALNGDLAIVADFSPGYENTSYTYNDLEIFVPNSELKVGNGNFIIVSIWDDKENELNYSEPYSFDVW